MQLLVAEFIQRLDPALNYFAFFELQANNTELCMTLKNMFIIHYPWISDTSNTLLHVCVVCECLCFERVSRCPAWS